MTYYLLDTLDYSDDGLIKIKSEWITPELKSLAESAARREKLQNVAVIFFHMPSCSVNQMVECMTYWEKFRSRA